MILTERKMKGFQSSCDPFDELIATCRMDRIVPCFHRVFEKVVSWRVSEKHQKSFSARSRSASISTANLSRVEFYVPQVQPALDRHASEVNDRRNFIVEQRGRMGSFPSMTPESPRETHRQLSFCSIHFSRT